uniref:Uncharacterized protein n=1 Tax=Romanomermis culicivorax TaxID=13658 RepID=A0A915K992_ROMCU
MKLSLNAKVPTVILQVFRDAYYCGSNAEAMNNFLCGMDDMFQKAELILNLTLSLKSGLAFPHRTEILLGVSTAGIDEKSILIFEDSTELSSLSTQISLGKTGKARYSDRSTTATSPITAKLEDM